MRRIQVTLSFAGLAVLAVLIGFAPASANAIEPDRHVLIIGIDGCRPDAIQAADAPNLKKLAADGAVTWDGFAGGVLGTPTRQNTASLASWNTILRGVWANKHRAIQMKKGKPMPADRNYPSLFARIKQSDPKAVCASICNWIWINGQPMLPEADYKINGQGDAGVVDLLTKYLADKDPTAVFIHFDEVDHAGHANGFDPRLPTYKTAVETADKHVGEVLDAVKKRKNYAQEKWLIICVTDHGGINKGHGGDSPEERTVFLIANGPGVKPGGVSPGPGLVAVTPTALKFLGVPIKPEWKLDGQPFGLGD
ncbi:MAG: alkaline phosphatase family protein [Planctomycetia bacterium]|nr:alkaline phosphatase family protein [Planctomycetia bacterium]